MWSSHVQSCALEIEYMVGHGWLLLSTPDGAQSSHPPSDPSLTLGNVKGALSRVLRWRDVGEWLFVPSAVLDQICVKYMKDMRASALAEYVVTFLPALTWEGITAALHYCGEKKAMECVMPYVHTLPGESVS